MPSSDDRADRLIVILEGRPIGRIDRDRHGLVLTYDDAYLDESDATVLSVSMPPPMPRHNDAVVSAWLWGLLPDNEAVLRRWGREFGVSARSPFDLLAAPIGHDCAGAVQFCRPDDVDRVLDRAGTIQPLSEREIADRLRALRSDATTWLGPTGTGQFSLAGAQAKTALAFDPISGWGQPSGSAPTTHLLKPAVVGLDGHDLNEHLCLAAARVCGLVAARTHIEAFEDQTAIVVERYDRYQLDGAITRVHQEDLCQAMGIPPTLKYQADGGPSPVDVVELLRSIMTVTESEAAIDRFVDALAFNWVVAGTDAHAKNYSLLHSGHQTRLAPLYDIASALPYDTTKGHKLKLAMKLGRDYRLTATDRASSWQLLAEQCGLRADDVVDRVAALAARMGDAFATVAEEPTVLALGSDLPARLVDAVAARAASCTRILG